MALLTEYNTFVETLQQFAFDVSAPTPVPVFGLAQASNLQFNTQNFELASAVRFPSAAPAGESVSSVFYTWR